MTTTPGSVVADTVELLWPGRPGGRCYRVLPTATRPRLLVPERPRAAAVAGLRAVRESTSRQSRARTAAVSAAFSTAPTRLLPGERVVVGDGGIDQMLGDTLGTTVVATVHLGPDRANRKPVLALATPDGSIVGFAKVAVDDLTGCLVTAEGTALRVLSQQSLRQLTVPRLLFDGTWHDSPTTVQSPLPVHTERTSADPLRVAAAQVELARCLGVTTSSAAESAYVRQLMRRLKAQGPVGAQVADEITTAVGAVDLTLAFGAWHGDWRPTNCAVTGSTVLVWDWERFATEVPLGFDALHLALTSRARATEDITDLAPMLYSLAPGVLETFDVDSAKAELVTSLYLGEIAARYLTDGQHRTGARLGDVGAWLLPELHRRNAVIAS